MEYFQLALIVNDLHKYKVVPYEYEDLHQSHSGLCLF